MKLIILLLLAFNLYAQDYIVEWKVIRIIPDKAPVTKDEYGIMRGGGSLTDLVYRVSYDTTYHSKRFETEAEADKFIENMPFASKKMNLLVGTAWVADFKKYKVKK